LWRKKLFFVFMWVWQFLRHHKTAIECGCFLGSERFSSSGAVWQQTFHAHANIAPMLKTARCGGAGIVASPFFNHSSSAETYVLAKPFEVV